ncbi:MAG: phosphatidylserine/phosphatidylglycerophosphate/cardiolipin synthase family protein [Flavobacterium sp.]|nr:MAG: phosphatidylserine/phosphatidylglycerophosphate/cardiolipin synthase family protein [Flavobacterium sp.]
MKQRYVLTSFIQTDLSRFKDYIWLLTFIYDNSFSATQTLRKLNEAQKRGVKVCLMIDDINNRADKSLKTELIHNGALVYSLNPVIPYFTSFNFSRELFRRHHEKVFIADDVAIIGSANITDEYSGPVYGSDDYMDLNIILKNLCTSKVRNFFREIADHYKHRLDKQVSNEEIITRYDELYKESIFNIPKLSLLKAHPPHIEQIQDFVIQNIDSAQESIRIIQPYYYPIKRFESVLLKALQRGVKVELVTAGKRHTSVYAPLKNSILLNEMLKNGLDVYEIHDKLLHMKMYQFDDKIYTAGSFF